MGGDSVFDVDSIFVIDFFLRLLLGIVISRFHVVFSLCIASGLSPSDAIMQSFSSYFGGVFMAESPLSTTFLSTIMLPI